MLRQLNSYPLRGGGWSTGANLKPDQKKPTARTTQYFVDDHAIATMGLKLLGGRNFRPDDISTVDYRAVKTPGAVIVTKALADQLYPDGSALGKSFYLGDDKTPTTIIGIVDRLQTPWTGNWADEFMENSVMLPIQLSGNFSTYLHLGPSQDSRPMCLGLFPRPCSRPIACVCCATRPACVRMTWFASALTRLTAAWRS